MMSYYENRSNRTLVADFLGQVERDILGGLLDLSPNAQKMRDEILKRMSQANQANRTNA